MNRFFPSFRFALSFVFVALLLPAPAIIAQNAKLELHATYAAILNQAKTSAPVQAIVNQLGKYTVEKLDLDEANYYYSFPTRAVEVHFSEDHVVDTVAFLNKAVFKSEVQYPGSLPENLTFKDREADVIKKLGAPEESEDFPDDQERLLYYDERGLTVFFFAGDDERKGQIKLVEIYLP